jgi:DNA modification methylase
MGHPVRSAVDAPGEPTLVFGNSMRMQEVESHSAALALTSPPYFPPEVADELFAGFVSEDRISALATAIESYAWSLRGVFEECWRVLTPGGHLALQTRDVRLRSRLVPVEAIHREVCEAVGFALFSRHFWRPLHTTVPRRRSLDALRSQHGPVPFDPEVFLVFSTPGLPHRGRPRSEDISLLQQDIMRTSVGRMPQRHRFQSPVPVVRALVRTYTMPNDLVVDPFAGGGTTLRVATALGRRSIGYDIDPRAIDLAAVNLAVQASCGEDND